MLLAGTCFGVRRDCKDRRTLPARSRVREWGCLEDVPGVRSQAIRPVGHVVFLVDGARGRGGMTHPAMPDGGENGREKTGRKTGNQPLDVSLHLLFRGFYRTVTDLSCQPMQAQAYDAGEPRGATREPGRISGTFRVTRLNTFPRAVRDGHACSGHSRADVGSGPGQCEALIMTIEWESWDGLGGSVRVIRGFVLESFGQWCTIISSGAAG